MWGASASRCPELQSGRQGPGQEGVLSSHGGGGELLTSPASASSSGTGADDSPSPALVVRSCSGTSLTQSDSVSSPGPRPGLQEGLTPHVPPLSPCVPPARCSSSRPGCTGAKLHSLLDHSWEAPRPDPPSCLVGVPAPCHPRTLHTLGTRGSRAPQQPPSKWPVLGNSHPGRPR